MISFATRLEHGLNGRCISFYTDTRSGTVYNLHSAPMLCLDQSYDPSDTVYGPNAPEIESGFDDPDV